MVARRGFTFVELLVVVAVIAALVGMALAGLSVLRRNQKIASTLDLMTHMTTAIDQYLREFPRLGHEANSRDFLDDPWAFLSKYNQKLGKEPYIDVPLARLVTKTGTGTCIRADSSRTATHVCDHFGNNPTNVFTFQIINNSKRSGASFAYTQAIIFRSAAGTRGDPKDDLIYAYSSDKASWRKLRLEDLDDFAAEIDRTPAPILEREWKDPLE